MFHLSLHHGRFTPPLLLVYNIFPSRACILQVMFQQNHQNPYQYNFWFLNRTSFFPGLIESNCWIDYPVDGDKSSPLAFDLASAALRSLGHGGASCKKRRKEATWEHKWAQYTVWTPVIPVICHVFSETYIKPVISITLEMFFHMFRQQMCHPFGPALAVPSHSGAEGTLLAADAPFASEATIGKGVKGWWIIIYIYNYL